MPFSWKTPALLTGPVLIAASGAYLTMLAPACELHHTQMHGEIKTLIYGLTMGQPAKPIAQFPNSHPEVFAGSCFPGSKGTYRFVWVCSVCRQREQQWKRQHPAPPFW